MQAIERRRIHASISEEASLKNGNNRIHAGISYDTPLNNSNQTIYDILKALPFKNFVKSNEYKLLLKTLSDFDCFNVNESEFHAV